MRPRTCSRNGAYHNASEQYTLDLCVVECLTETGNDENCMFLSLQKYDTR